jgi:hypothetical protein
VAGSGIVWAAGRSPADLAKALDLYERKAMAAVAALAKYFEPVLEHYAKSHRPWTDRTGNARQTMFSVSEMAGDVVRLYLSHGMEYGKWLELCNNGKYAVVMRTLEAHYGEIKRMLDRLLKD